MGFYSTSWKEFDSSLRDAVKKRSSYRRKGKKGMKLAKENFTREMGNKVFLQVLEGMVK
jgi:hypothetical protein